MNSNLTDPKEIRKFGAVGFILFGTFYCLAVWRERMILPFFFGGMAVVSICFLFFPIKFRPIYNAWLKVAHWISSNIIKLLLIIIYYLVMTPATWIKFIFGGSPLPLKPDATVSSYWVKRDVLVQPKDRFYKRY